jgi:2-polyprenyl-3-methyl-5-hydroxy-6-metoxy-1,4-benzoquinol methylase
MSLAARSTAEERMDTDCIDFDDYQRCLRDLARVNTVTLTHRPTLAWLAREMVGRTAFSLLDVACGHGDMLRRISRWADRSRITARLDGVDLNPWSTRAARAATPDTARITYHTGNVFAFEPEDGAYDFIISSQFTHHLTDGQIVMFIRWMEAHASRGWFIGDLHRHWFPYYGFGLLAWVARWHRFVLSDGRISIARSFVADDWRRLVRAAGLRDDDVTITWHVPFRLCVARRCLKQ